MDAVDGLSVKSGFHDLGVSVIETQILPNASWCYFHPTKSESLCAIWHSWTVTGSLMQSNRPTNAISISSDFHRVEPLISMMPCDPLPLPFPPKRACYEHMESHRGTRSVVYSWTALNFGLQNATNSRTRNTFHLYFDYIACWLFCLIPK